MPYRRASVPAIVCPVFVNGVHILRETARRGAYVVAVDTEENAIGFRSRYAKERAVIDPPERGGDALFDFLMSRRDLYGGIVVPTDDAYVREVHRHYDDLKPHYRLAVSPGESTAVALDKDRAYEAAAAAGLVVPRTVEVRGEKDLENAAREVGFPAILRAAFSLAFVKEFGRKNFPVENREELWRFYAKATASGHRMLLQERIPGPDELVHTVRGYAFDSGETSPLVVTSKRLQFPPIFGIGQLMQTLGAPALEEYALRLVRRLDYRGSIFGVEFKYDRRSKQWKFIELNCRSLMSTGCAKYSGVDLVECLWRDKMGLPKPPPGRVRYGRRWTYIKDGLLRHRGYPEHRKSLREYLWLYRPPMGFALLDLRDLRPWFSDIAPLFGRRFGRRKRRGAAEAVNSDSQAP
ncbi:MAG: carboxylate--amine ligase [Planctomycetota bacterium]